MSEDVRSTWTVNLTSKAAKVVNLLPLKVQDLALTLVRELGTLGPIQKRWKNFSPLSDVSYHCHIKKGKPTYVACWRVVDKRTKILEVFYVGTHENAPY